MAIVCSVKTPQQIIAERAPREPVGQAPLYLKSQSGESVGPEQIFSRLAERWNAACRKAWTPALVQEFYERGTHELKSYFGTAKDLGVKPDDLRQWLLAMAWKQQVEAPPPACAPHHANDVNDF